MANLLQFASQSSTVAAADNILIDISYDFNFNLVPLIVSLFAVSATQADLYVYDTRVTQEKNWWS